MEAGRSRILPGRWEIPRLQNPSIQEFFSWPNPTNGKQVREFYVEIQRFGKKRAA